MAGRRRTALDAVAALLARTLTGIFFRQVTVLDARRLPRDRPLVVVANHENSFVDAVLLAGFLGVRPRFLAKSTLFSHPVIAPLLALAGALPVHRRQDEGADPSRNVDTFARCHDELARGGAVMLFPEGASHNRPHRLPLKTGAARIALEAEALKGPLGLRVVPVGLIYDDKGTFRSRVIVQVGPPIDPAPETAAFGADATSAVRQLTERIALALGEVTLNHASWEEARLVGRASALLAQAAPGRAPTLAEVWPVRQRVWRAYDALRRRDSARADALARDVARYEQALTRSGVDPDDVLLAASPTAADGPALRSSVRLALSAPLALAGFVLNVIPYQVIDTIARRATRTPDEPATYKVLGALVFLPLTWITAAAIVWAAAGPLAGVATALAAPVTGYVALRWMERLHDWRARRRRRRLGPRDPWIAALAQQRRELQAVLGELLEAPVEVSG